MDALHWVPLQALLAANKSGAQSPKAHRTPQSPVSVGHGSQTPDDDGGDEVVFQSSSPLPPSLGVRTPPQAASAKGASAPPQSPPLVLPLTTGETPVIMSRLSQITLSTPEVQHVAAWAASVASSY